MRIVQDVSSNHPELEFLCPVDNCEGIKVDPKLLLWPGIGAYLECVRAAYSLRIDKLLLQA